jgi:hypothetical protein
MGERLGPITSGATVLWGGQRFRGYEGHPADAHAEGMDAASVVGLSVLETGSSRRSLRALRGIHVAGRLTWTTRPRARKPRPAPSRKAPGDGRCRT